MSDSEAWRSHIRISRILGFTGCYWMIVFWKLGIFNCLNQDFQDFRISRMRDLFADEVANLMVINCLNQDLQDEGFGG